MEHSFNYPDAESFWRGALTGAPARAAKAVVDENTLKEAVSKAVEPYTTDSEGIRLDNVYQNTAAPAV